MTRIPNGTDSTHWMFQNMRAIRSRGTAWMESAPITLQIADGNAEHVIATTTSNNHVGTVSFGGLLQQWHLEDMQDGRSHAFFIYLGGPLQTMKHLFPKQCLRMGLLTFVV